MPTKTRNEVHKKDRRGVPQGARKTEDHGQCFRRLVGTSFVESSEKEQRDSNVCFYRITHSSGIQWIFSHRSTWGDSPLRRIPLEEKTWMCPLTLILHSLSSLSIRRRLSRADLMFNRSRTLLKERGILAFRIRLVHSHWKNFKIGR